MSDAEHGQRERVHSQQKQKIHKETGNGLCKEFACQTEGFYFIEE